MSKGTSMAAHGRHRAKNANQAARRRGLAAVALGLGLAAATGHDVAWADTAASPDNASGPPSPGNNGPKAAIAPLLHHLEVGSSTAAKSSESGTPGDTDTANSTAPEPVSTLSAFTGKSRRGGGGIESSSSTAAKDLPAHFASRAESRLATTLSTALKRPAADTAPADAQTPASNASTFVAAAVISTTTTTPDPPGPLSPINKVIAAPGRFVNVVLQALDITASSKGPQSPLDFAPIDEALFAAFRRTEDVFGLSSPPTEQPVIAHQVYVLPSDAEKTPTVAQFLNAAAGEYVLGGQPEGLKPFTVDGKQMTSTNVLSGESAQAWVTPDDQIIIAYQGTTGGT